MTVGSRLGTLPDCDSDSAPVVVNDCEVAPATRNRGADRDTEAAPASRLPLPVNRISVPAVPVTAAKPPSVLAPAPKVSVSPAVRVKLPPDPPVLAPLRLAVACVLVRAMLRAAMVVAPPSP
jgi:hypothetical protein